MAFMMTIEQKLEQQIDEAVGEYLRASEQVATTVMQRAFLRARTTSPRATAAPAKRRATGPRNAHRSPEELAVLREKLSAAVHAHPGETMQVLSGHVGASPQSLQVAVAHLKRSDQLRTVGSRQFMRYFPATEAPPEA